MATLTTAAALYVTVAQHKVPCVVSRAGFIASVATDLHLTLRKPQLERGSRPYSQVFILTFAVTMQTLASHCQMLAIFLMISIKILFFQASKTF